MLHKVVVIGPESTGKSQLCKDLAIHYNTSWVPEYAREYLELSGNHYTLPDLTIIAAGQLALEKKMTDASSDRPVIFIDTDLYVIKVWSEFVFNACNNKILKEIAERKYDLYLLCDTDLPWAPDPLREYPDPAPREKLLHYYKDALIHQPVPWELISGQGIDRVNIAIRAIEKHLTV